MKSTAILPLTWLQKLLWLLGCGVFFVVVYFLHGMVQQSQVDSQLEQHTGEQADHVGQDAQPRQWRWRQTNALSSRYPLMTA